MARLKLFIPLLLVLLLGGLFFKILKTDDYDPQALPSALLEKPFPAFALPSLFEENKTIRETDIVGEPMLVNVWATWCPTCYYEHPYLVELKNRGVKIIGLNYKDDAGKARKVLTDTGNPYEKVIFDADGFLGIELGVTGAPETFVVDRDGLVRLRYQGALDQQSWDKKFSQLWQEINAP